MTAHQLLLTEDHAARVQEHIAIAYRWRGDTRIAEAAASAAGHAARLAAMAAFLLQPRLRGSG